MGVCCFQKKAISIQKKNIFIENREIDGKKKSIINDNDNDNDNKDFVDLTVNEQEDHSYEEKEDL